MSHILEFLDLVDTPNTFAGFPGGVIKVNSAADGLECAPAIVDTAELFTVWKDPTGFELTTLDSVYTFINDTFEISPTGASFDVWMYGTKYTKTSAESVVIPDVEGWHYVYYDNVAAALITSNVLDPDEIITSYAFVAAIYWDATNNEAIFIGDERHGLMPWSAHLRFSRDFGASYISGFPLDNFVFNGNGNSDAHCQFSIGNGVFDDADIRHVLADSGYPAQIPVYYLTGAGASWRRDAPTNAPIKNYDGGSSRAAYMTWSGSAWVQAEIPTYDYFLVHIFATNDIDNPYVAVQSHTYYGNRGEATNAVETDLSDTLALSLPFSSYVPLGTILYQTSNPASNTWKSRARTFSNGVEYVDWRFRTLPMAGQALSHSSLVDTDLDDSHPSTAIAVDSSGFSGNLSVADDSVFKALSTLDALVLAGEANTASNVGSGAGIFHQKIGADLEFRGVKSENNLLNVSVDFISRDIELTVDETNIDHESILNSGSYGHGSIDFHINNSSLHFAEGTIDHDNILNNGANDHAAIDSHIGDTAIHGYAPSVFYAYHGAGGVTIPTSWTDLPWPNEIRQDGDYAHIGSSAIVGFTSAGDYKVTVDVAANVSDSSRSHVDWRLVLDTGGGFVEVDGSRAATYHRSAADGRNSASITILLEGITVGDELKVQGDSDRSTQVTTLPDGCRIYIEKK